MAQVYGGDGTASQDRAVEVEAVEDRWEVRVELAEAFYGVEVRGLGWCGHIMRVVKCRQ